MSDFTQEELNAAMRGVTVLSIQKREHNDPSGWYEIHIEFEKFGKLQHNVEYIHSAKDEVDAYLKYVQTRAQFYRDKQMYKEEFEFNRQAAVRQRLWEIEQTQGRNYFKSRHKA